MKIKAKYCKEIEVIDELSQEEINDLLNENILPDRFDCIADNIDNEKPLMFQNWEEIPCKMDESPIIKLINLVRQKLRKENR
jgi:hypothetical protein